MPGPLDPRTDKVMRSILLDRLRGTLAAYEWNKLDLQQLEPLRTEVARELASLKEKPYHADADGDCSWLECPQKVNYQQWCPLATRGEGRAGG